MTPAASYAGSNNGSVPSSTEILSIDTTNLSSHETSTTNPDILKQALLKQPLGDEVRLAILKSASSKKASSSSINMTSEGLEAVSNRSSITRLHLGGNPSEIESSPPAVPKRSTSYDLFRVRPGGSSASTTEAIILPKLSPPTPFADEAFVADTLPHLMTKQTYEAAGVLKSASSASMAISKTLPRRMPTGKLSIQFIDLSG